MAEIYRPFIDLLGFEMSFRIATVTSACVVAAASTLLVIFIFGVSGATSGPRSVAFGGFYLALLASTLFALRIPDLGRSSGLAWVRLGGVYLASTAAACSFLAILLASCISLRGMLVVQLILVASVVFLGILLSHTAHKFARMEMNEAHLLECRQASRELCRNLISRSSGGPYSDRIELVSETLNSLPVSLFGSLSVNELRADLHLLCKAFDDESPVLDEVLSRCEDCLARLY